MLFLKRTAGRIEFFIARKQKVYCQKCWEELTEKGAFVTDTGEAYCSHGSWCVEEAVMMRGVRNAEGDFYKSEDLQYIIREGILCKYSLPSNPK